MPRFLGNHCTAAATSRNASRDVFSRSSMGIAGIIAAVGLTVAGIGSAAAQSSTHKAVLKVNGKPITESDIKYRVNLILMSSPDVRRKIAQQTRARAQARFKSKNINQEFRSFLVKRQPRSREEAKKLQKVFGRQIYQRAEAQVRRTVGKGLRKRALSELIDDRLKIDLARKRGMLLDGQEINRRFGVLAKDNKMTAKQFETMLRGRGIHPKAFKAQMRARGSWARVAQARLRSQVSIRAADIDSAMAGDPAAERGKATELDLREVLLPTSEAFDMRRYVDAQDLGGKFRSCKALPALVKRVSGAKLRSLPKARASAIPENARPSVMATAVGKISAPVFTSKGVALYAVCGRQEVANNDKARAATRQKLRSAKLNTLARNLLRSLCQEAYFDPSLSSANARCGES
ncbi:MAG: SurA N-terminal domain-containing protein [Pseudomonadota bacterium]